MSLHFLLDAYNIIYQIPSLSKGSLEEQRRRFIAFIDSKRPQGSLNNKVTIVFDGKGEHFSRESAKTARVLFAKHETADEAILRIVDEAKNRKSIIVVTNDRPVQYAIRALGAKVLSVRDFIKRGEPSLIPRRTKKATPAQNKEASKEISKTTQHKINTEMSSIWLKNKGSQ